MTVDDLLKIILVVSISFAIIGTAWQFMRILSRIADSLGEVKKIAVDVSELSSLTLSDYRSIRELGINMAKTLTSIEKMLDLITRRKRKASPPQQSA